MLIFLVLLTIAVNIFLVYAEGQDVKVSEQCFAKGFVEGNDLIVYFFGPKPTARQLHVYNTATIALWQVPAIVCLVVGNYPAGYGASVAVTLANAGKHLLAARKGRMLLAGTWVESKNAWKKFLGL